MAEANHLSLAYSFTQQALGVLAITVQTIIFHEIESNSVFYVITDVYSSAGLPGGMVMTGNVNSHLP